MDHKGILSIVMLAKSHLPATLQPAALQCALCLAVQARAMTVDQVLFGYYTIPVSQGAPLQVVVNPEGTELRGQKR